MAGTPTSRKQRGRRREGIRSASDADPGIEPKEEDIRYVSAVLLTLTKGSVEDKREVAAIVRSLIKKQPWNKRGLVAANGLKVLFDLLFESDDPQTIEDCVTTVLNVANDEICEEEVLAANGFAALVRVLEVGSEAAKANASAALYVLGESPEYKVSILEAGAIGPLLRVLLSSCDIRTRKDAALVLYQISLHPRCAKEIVLAGGVMALAGAMAETAHGHGLEEKVASTFKHLAKSTEGRLALEEEGGISCLTNILHSTEKHRAQESALAALLLLATTSSGAVDKILAQSGIMPRLNTLIVKGERSNVRAKAKALMELLRMAGDEDEEYFAISPQNYDDHVGVEAVGGGLNGPSQKEATDESKMKESNHGVNKHHHYHRDDEMSIEGEFKQRKATRDEIMIIDTSSSDDVTVEVKMGCALRRGPTSSPPPMDRNGSILKSRRTGSCILW
eukprot:TRINITY_DN23585_c0_g1_i1.p1 TRINITY_DN23585_c0_g1~~TRINITY_DN23585_c0_g1_i1.p1  ORF type:complete len:480 (-),score=77.02 TRINITY_DN23585_c0_g1_i1:453-1799(-)